MKIYEVVLPFRPRPHNERWIIEDANGAICGFFGTFTSRASADFCLSNYKGWTADQWNKGDWIRGSIVPYRVRDGEQEEAAQGEAGTPPPEPPKDRAAILGDALARLIGAVERWDEMPPDERARALRDAQEVLTGPPLTSADDI